MYNTALRLLVSVSTVSTTTLVSPVVPVPCSNCSSVVVAVEDCSTEEADVELLTMTCLEHAVMSAALSVETLFEAHNTKQCVQRQQGRLQCCRASCRLGLESTAEVVRGCDSVCLRTKGKYRNVSFITDRLPESGLLRR